MSKQDSNGVRTAQDIERKYDFASMLGLKKNVETSEKGLTEIKNELLNFMNATVGDMKDLQDQIDGKVTTWYYNGQPSLENYPVNTWDDDKENHIGDLYYDKDTGYCYIFQKDNETYMWQKIEDKDVIESLALANSAKDTADNKRQIFIKEPKTPYDVGDFWINNNEIFICQVTRKTGDFNSKDWINNLKYTDDTVAEAVDNKVTVLSGTVTEITQNYVKFTDLATSGSTTIAGDNIKTGVIKSNNYIEGKTGMLIKLLDGSIDTKNFKLDAEGNTECSNMKITGGNLKMESSKTYPNFKICDSNTEDNSNLYATGIDFSSKDDQNKVTGSYFYDGFSLYHNRCSKDLVEVNYAESSRYKTTSDTGLHGRIQLKAENESTTNILPGIMDFKYGDSYTQVSAENGLVHSSREEYKKNISKFENNLDLIRRASVYEYLFKQEPEESKKHIGLIIGDKYGTPKEIISSDETGIDFFNMCGVMWGAIKEQQEEIEYLKTKLNEMEVNYDKNR